MRNVSPNVKRVWNIWWSIPTFDDDGVVILFWANVVEVQWSGQRSDSRRGYDRRDHLHHEHEHQHGERFAWLIIHTPSCQNCTVRRTRDTARRSNERARTRDLQAHVCESPAGTLPTPLGRLSCWIAAARAYNGLALLLDTTHEVFSCTFLLLLFYHHLDGRRVEDRAQTVGKINGRDQIRSPHGNAQNNRFGYLCSDARESGLILSWAEDWFTAT